MSHQVFLGTPISGVGDFHEALLGATFETTTDALQKANEVNELDASENGAFVIGNEVDLITKINEDKLDTENNYIAMVFIERL